MSLVILGDSIAVGIGGQLGGGKTVAEIGASPQAIAGYSFTSADWIVLSIGSNGNDAAGVPALNAALATIFAKAKDSKWIFILPVKEPARSVVQAFAALHGNRTVSFAATPTDSLGVHPASYKPLADAALAFMRADDPAAALTPLQKIVAQLDPLLKSLIGGQDIHRGAVWGQTLQESNGNPAAIEKPGTELGGIGLWQHTGSRRRTLEAFAANRGKPWQDAETQVRFVAQELLGPEAHAWAQTQKTTTPEAATETFMLDYERPAVQGGPPTYGTARLDVRVRGTHQALAVIQAAKSGGKTVTDTSAVTPAPAVVHDNVLSDWIKKNEVPAETVIRQLLVAKGFPGFLVDLIFSALNPLLDQLLEQIHPEDIGNLIAQHVIQPLLANLNLPKK